MGQSQSNPSCNTSTDKQQQQQQTAPRISFPNLPTIAPREPTDNRFVQSFSLQELEDGEYLTFFDEYGFVVIRDVLNSQEIESAIQDIWNVICGVDPSTSEYVQSLKELYDNFQAVDMKDPTTWTPSNGYPVMEELGMLGNQIATQHSAFINRQNEHVYQVFKSIIGRDDLHVSLDRFGVMRPTKQVLLADGKTRRDFPEYQTREKWMHWDLNPFKLTSGCDKTSQDGKQSFTSIDSIDVNAFFCLEGNRTCTDYRQVQGFIALSESTEEDGGFICVPTFHKHILEWARANREYETTLDFVSVPNHDPLRNQGCKIPVRAGSLVIWDSRLPHCNYPNNSDKFRYVQYVKMFPANVHLLFGYDDNETEKRRAVVKQLLEKSGFEPSELGKKLFGIEDW